MTKRTPFWVVLAIFLFVFIFLIRSILLPFVLGIFTAYFLDPAADRLEEAGLSRGLSTLVITICFFSSIVLLSVIIIPLIMGQFSGLIEAFPGYMADFDKKFAPDAKHWLNNFPMVNTASIKSTFANVSDLAVKYAGAFIAGIFQSGMAFVNLLSLVLITPVVAFYLLRDWDRLVERLDTLLPRAHAPIIRTQLLIIDQTLAGFARGQVNICLILATYYAIALSLAGLKFGIVIGLATGFLVIVPYVGFLLGMTTALGVAFFQFDNYFDIGFVALIFGVGQIAEGYFLVPRLIGKRVGLHPVWIIFGMLSGATLFGFVGVLLAVPATAVIGVLLRFALSNYVQSEYYQGERPLITSTQ